MRDHAALQLKGGIGCIIRIGFVGCAALIETLGDMSSADAADRLYRAEQVVEHVAPMGEHVENDASAIRFAVIPGRPLRRLQIALKYPVTELTPHREHAPAKARVFQH